MPMSFPDMKSLIRAAECHKFRTLNEGETEESYRKALADHVVPIDFIESQEIRTGKGWDQWNTEENKNMLMRLLMRKYAKSVQERARDVAEWFAKKYMEPRRAPTYCVEEMTETVIFAIQAAVRDRDMEWWQSRALVDNVATTPEAVKQWIAVETEHAVQKARRETLEEAARAAEQRGINWPDGSARACADAIRALGGADGRT